MTAPQLTRRELLKKGTGVALLSYLGLRYSTTDADQPQASPVTEQQIVFGVVERVSSNTSINIRNRDGRVSIQPAQDAIFSRGDRGLVPDLSLYVRRDEVIAEGTWATGSFVATLLMTLYRVVEGHIVERQGDLIKTTAGNIRLTSVTTPIHGDQILPKPLDQLNVGDHVWAEGWRDPAIGQFAALRIGVRS